MKTRIHKQRGMTAIGWVIVLLLIAFFTTLVLRIGPVYLENYQVKSILKGFDEVADLSSKSKSQIKVMINNKLNINSINTVTAYDKGKGKSAGDFTITKQDKKLSIDIKYEVRKKIFYNIDVVISFEEHYDTVFH